MSSHSTRCQYIRGRACATSESGGTLRSQPFTFDFSTLQQDVCTQPLNGTSLARSIESHCFTVPRLVRAASLRRVCHSGGSYERDVTGSYDTVESCIIMQVRFGDFLYELQYSPDIAGMCFTDYPYRDQAVGCSDPFSDAGPSGMSPFLSTRLTVMSLDA
ncbi:hypothetical protein DAEQUDRAFT_2915 [Daedalea quercina L-15889]|uniref:Uncharacterized protein n=1 Tax=Daedalea quercina L-15889 TaxID=1314783 RepID=A0A165UC51_9APHY|nr:hypothetical protein DAEQUDRAFT_2915 [Daedalea quercina L-15889]